MHKLLTLWVAALRATNRTWLRLGPVHANKQKHLNIIRRLIRVQINTRA